MDAINALGIIRQPVVTPAAPRVPAAVPQAEAKPEAPQIKLGGAGADVPTIDAKRYAAVKQAAEAIANPYVLGDKSFTIFKDSTGQLITRFFSKRDGKVTYLPEPQLLKASVTSEPALLKIKV